MLPDENASAAPDDLTLFELLTYAQEHDASDLILKTGSPPMLRALGRIVRTPFPVLDADAVTTLALDQVGPEQRQHFGQDMELNIGFTVPGVTRVRQNILRERGNVATVCRLLPLKVRRLDEIGVHSPAVKRMTDPGHGLVLVTGPTGSGKSTTLAGMVDLINSSQPVNIVTLEDPVEYVHDDQQATVLQREIGVDTHSFGAALRNVVRQTPDVILVGEMRDLETLDVALQASETGHLVFGTLHTASAAETLDRISNMFEPHERQMLWLRLSVSLRGVVSQKLLRKADESGRVVAQEIMVVTPTISKMLEEGKSEDIYALIRQDGQEHYWGMQTMNQCLENYVMEGIVSEEDALANAGNVPELKQMLRRSHAVREPVLQAA